MILSSTFYVVVNYEVIQNLLTKNNGQTTHVSISIVAHFLLLLLLLLIYFVSTCNAIEYKFM